MRPAAIPTTPKEIFNQALAAGLVATDFADVPVGVSCATFMFELANIANGVEWQVHWTSEDGVETIETAIDSGNINNTIDPMDVPMKYVNHVGPLLPAGYGRFDFTIAVPANKALVGLAVLGSAGTGNCRITVSFS